MKTRKEEERQEKETEKKIFTRQEIKRKKLKNDIDLNGQKEKK